MAKHLRERTIRISLGLLAVVSAGLAAGCGGDGGSTGGDVETFTAHGISLTATTTRAADSLTTTVSKDGVDQLTSEFRVTGVSLSFPDGTPNTIPFSVPPAALPTSYAANLLATYIVANQQAPTGSRQDSPGCDWFPDTQCTLGCCAQHDLCYQENGCGASSWLLGILAPSACINCNSIVVACISTACAGTVATTEEDRCYDNRCHQFYDCDAANCDCASPCDVVSPPTCGNGSCEVGETRDNCAGDCTDGSGLNQCCVDTDGCPSETPDSCPGACCCCGFGEVCSFETDLCAPSR